jgi:hypothetical protein
VEAALFQQLANCVAFKMGVSESWEPGGEKLLSWLEISTFGGNSKSRAQWPLLSRRVCAETGGPGFYSSLREQSRLARFGGPMVSNDHPFQVAPLTK